MSVHPGAWAAILVSALIAVGAWHFDVSPTRIFGDKSAPPAPAPVFPVPPSARDAPRSDKLVRLAPRPKLDVPVARVTRWRITDPRFGTIEVIVPVGKTPRDAMVDALTARGYQVVP